MTITNLHYNYQDNTNYANKILYIYNLIWKIPLKKIKNKNNNNYIQALGLFYNYECFN